MKLLFFIPTFNDQQGLSEMIQDLLCRYPEAKILVIDDGSIPAINLTKNLSSESRLLLLRLASNEGLGLSTSIALDYMLKGDYECLVRLDADGQHPHNEIDGLKEEVLLNLADVVWSERINHYKRSSLKGIMASVTKIFHAWLGRIIFKSNLTDWFSGFFAINRVAAKVAQSAYLERYCEVQLICIFHLAKLRIETHKIEQIDRKHGKSSISWVIGMMIILRSSFIMLLYALRVHSK